MSMSMKPGKRALRAEAAMYDAKQPKIGTPEWRKWRMCLAGERASKLINKTQKALK